MVQARETHRQQLTIIINPNGKKLSKRDHNILQFMSQYKELGYIPEAVLNFLFLLGYTDAEGREIISKEEAIASFDPSRLSKSPAMFDSKRLLWINSHYIRNLDDDKYFEFIKPFIDKVELNESLDKKEIALLFKNEIQYGAQIVDLLNEILVKNTELSDEENEILNKESSLKVKELFKNKLMNVSEISQESIKNIFNEIKTETGLKGKDIFMPIRLALTGHSHGIEMHNLVKILGKEECFNRL